MLLHDAWELEVQGSQPQRVAMSVPTERTTKSPINDTDSLEVNPGSPRSPPPLNHETLEQHLSSTTEEFDLKDVDFQEKISEETEAEPEHDGLRFIIDPAGDLTHDETTVDVVTVPCPGGDPLRSWNRDGLISRYFGAPSMRYAEGEGDDRPRPSWVRQGIRREASPARILLYEHPAVIEDTTLSRLADALLQELQALRAREARDRPLIFIGHSVGGIVIKMALVKASRDVRYDGIFKECYGMAFFGKTSDRGSRVDIDGGVSHAASGIQLLCDAESRIKHPRPASALGATSDLHHG